MQSVVGRRVFVGSVAAGVPLLAGAGIKAFAQAGAAAPHNHPVAATAEDPVLRQLVREIAATHNAARARRPRGEDARALASQLRTLSVYAKQLDLAAKSIRQLAAHVRSERAALGDLLVPSVERFIGFMKTDRTTPAAQRDGNATAVEHHPQTGHVTALGQLYRLA